MDASAIVKKIEPKNNQDTGTVQPLIIEQQNKLPQIANPEDFPNEGKIFIVHGYDRYINNSYDVDELFRLFRFRPNNSSSVDPSSPYYCDYMAIGDDAKELVRDEYFHLVDTKFEEDQLPTTISMKYKPKRTIMLASVLTDHYYGPFDYEEPERKSDSGLYDIRLKACERLPGFQSPNYLVLKVPKDSFESVSTGRENILVARISDLTGGTYEEVDFISNEQLIRWGNERIVSRSPDKGLRKKELKEYQFLISQLINAEEKFAVRRKKRLLEIFTRLDLWQDERANIIENYLNTPAGEEQIKKYVESPGIVLDSAKEHLEKELGETQKHLDDEIARLVEIKQQRENYIAELEAKNKLTEHQQEQELTQNLKDLTEELKRNTQELDEICERINVASNIQSLQDQERVHQLLLEHVRKQAQEEEKKQKDTLDELKKTKREIERNIKTTHEDLKRKLAEVARDDKPYLDILNGIIPTITNDEITVPRKVNERQDKPVTAKELIDEVCSALKSDFGRDYRFEDVANYVLCIHQNFLTVFAGLPGVGKTSLITYLAKALGIEDQGLFLTVSTARGMTSQRDLLGYYNPLSQRYQPSQTGLYQYLEALKQDEKPFPYWVLLDEANLSPIEHYFSSFLIMCDDYVAKILTTGEPGSNNTLGIPSSLRFMATVNYDNTTEPLSPRVIDRVPVIYIEAPKGFEISSIGPSETAPIKATKEVLSYTDFQSLFSTEGTNEDTFTDNESRILKNIVDSLESIVEAKKGSPAIVSPRKWKQICRYCCAGREIMKGEEGKGSSLRALDYAVAQHILPLINGNGDKYRRRLDDLQKAVEYLDKSKGLLTRIINVGEEDQKFYRFFC
jgi:MoxR-like ATPase